MRVFVVFLLVGGGYGLPRVPREGAEVIQVVDENLPILLSSPQQPESDNSIVPLTIGGENSTIIEQSTVSSPQQPTPVPENVAITTEEYQKVTPALVPAVVDVGTANPNNTPPPPANATTPVPAEEESDEEDASDEADEEQSGEEDDEEEDDEDEEEDDEEDEEDAKEKKLNVKRVARGEVSSSFKESAGEDLSDEDKLVDKQPDKLKPVGLQGVPGNVGAGEDDEADSNLQTVGKGTSVVISGD